MTAAPRPPRAARAGRRAVIALTMLVGLMATVAGGPAATAAPVGRVVEPVARHDSSTGSPRSSTSSSTGESGNSPSTSTGTAGSSTGSGNPVTVTLAEVNPPTAGSSTISVRGTLSATVAGPLTGLQLSLEVGDAPITSRERLATFATNTAAARALTYRPLSLTGGVRAQPLTTAPSFGAAPLPFELTGDLGGPAAAGVGVYPLRVRVSGSVAGRAAAPIGAAYTFVVRSSGQARRTPVAVVLPLADQPRLRSDGLLTDNTLADEVKPDGRLGLLLAAARPSSTTLTLAVDPTLVQALWVMRKPYEYASPGGKVPAPADPNAVAFLSGLVDFAGAGGTIIPLPYGDADVTALVHAQKLDTVKYAVNTGEVVLAELLNRAPRLSGTVSYPADGLADTTTVDVLRQLKVGTVLLDDRLLPASNGIPYTPSAAVDLATSAGPIRALATDHRLADLATAPTSGAGSPGAGALLARFQAELGMITAERGQARPQVLALPRNWAPSGDWAQRVLAAVDSDYSVSVPLADLTAAGQASAPRGGLVYPADARARELPASYLDAVANVQEEAQALGPVLCPPGPSNDDCRQQKVKPMTNALVTATSVWWRGDRMVDGVSLSHQVDGDVSGIRNGIRVVASRSVKLTSRHGRVPITLENDTQYTVTVVLDFSSTNRSRLRSAARETRMLQPGQKAQIEIEVDAEKPGTFPLEIRRLNLDGQPLSTDPPKLVLVRSTVYGAIATGITIVAVSLLGLAVVLRLARRLRAGTRRQPDNGSTAGPDAATGMGPEDDAAADAAQPGGSGAEAMPAPDGVVHTGADHTGAESPSRWRSPAPAGVGLGPSASARWSGGAGQRSGSPGDADPIHQSGAGRRVGPDSPVGPDPLANPGSWGQSGRRAAPAAGREPVGGWEQEHGSPTFRGGRSAHAEDGPEPDGPGPAGRDDPAGPLTRRRRSGP
ncbi:conserved exported hypothetical protein [Frankia canadensis]|uniref:Secreted protein n=1 Tax=Frankia canadensis TaxID=1836972 RepID=A0A2I2L0K8_9ACTN|nr:DUF6049 family protein [Frankia canadensis]SNQ51440.1 conserved exported hypothetical protein [Frankia canadensis]SOU58730.1 conserved exported hypothetical protein [Frankia canadensis]